jgi:hypothetical protein
MPQAHDGAGVESARSFLHYGPKQYCRAIKHRSKTSLRSCTLSEAAIIATCIKTSLGRRGQSGCKRCGTFLFVWASCRRGLKLYRRSFRCRSAAGRLDVDPVAFYSADKTAIDVVSETASNVRHTLDRVGRTDEANLIGEICVAADTIVPLLWNLDTTTDGDVVIDAGSAGRVPADNSADPFIAVCAPVRRLRSRFELALTHLTRRNGPEARVSLGLVVSQLCDLWRRETGRPVTANPVRRASTRAAQNRHPDGSCARPLKLCSRPPLGLPNTRRSEPTCAPQS